MSKFEEALSLVLKHEGSYSDNPNDEGGATQNGISLRFYRKRIKPDATAADLQKLTINDITEIYRKYFWERQPFDEIACQKLCDRVFDLQVNTGQGVSLLQKAINSCIGSHLVIDNSLGHKTLDAANSILEQNLYHALIIQAEHYYNEIAKHADNHIFLHGWLNRLKN